MQHVKPNRADTEYTKRKRTAIDVLDVTSRYFLRLSLSLSLSVLDVSSPYHVLSLICRSCRATSGGPNSKVMFQLRSLNFRESIGSQAATLLNTSRSEPRSPITSKRTQSPNSVVRSRGMSCHAIVILHHHHHHQGTYLSYPRWRLQKKMRMSCACCCCSRELTGTNSRSKQIIKLIKRYKTILTPWPANLSQQVLSQHSAQPRKSDMQLFRRHMLGEPFCLLLDLTPVRSASNRYIIVTLCRCWRYCNMWRICILLEKYR